MSYYALCACCCDLRISWKLDFANLAGETRLFSEMRGGQHQGTQHGAGGASLPPPAPNEQRVLLHPSFQRKCQQKQTDFTSKLLCWLWGVFCHQNVSPDGVLSSALIRLTEPLNQPLERMLSQSADWCKANAATKAWVTGDGLEGEAAKAPTLTTLHVFDDTLQFSLEQLVCSSVLMQRMF